MEAWIKYKGNTTDHYCRFGKEIPKIEMKIDICNYFNCTFERAQFIAKQLLSDIKIECKLHKSASDSVRNIQVNIEKEVLKETEIKEEIKINEIEKAKRKPRIKKED